jgi:hypothetical protein
MNNFGEERTLFTRFNKLYLVEIRSHGDVFIPILASFGSSTVTAAAIQDRFHGFLFRNNCGGGTWHILKDGDGFNGFNQLYLVEIRSHGDVFIPIPTSFGRSTVTAAAIQDGFHGALSRNNGRGGVWHILADGNGVNGFRAKEHGLI